MNPKVEALIVCYEPRGKETADDPCRIVTRIYRLDGEFVAEYDPVKYAK